MYLKEGLCREQERCDKLEVADISHKMESLDGMRKFRGSSG